MVTLETDNIKRRGRGKMYLLLGESTNSPKSVKECFMPPTERQQISSRPRETITTFLSEKAPGDHFQKNLDASTFLRGIAMAPGLLAVAAARTDRDGTSSPRVHGAADSKHHLLTLPSILER